MLVSAFKPNQFYDIFHGIKSPFNLLILFSAFYFFSFLMASSSVTFVAPNLSQLVSAMLDETNYLMWLS